MGISSKIFAHVFVLSVISTRTSAVSLNKFLTLTNLEKQKLDQFRTQISPNLPHDYMKEESYLIKWLRVNAFDIVAAEKGLMRHVEWREENKIDTILNEDWSDFDHEYKAYIEGCDKEGRPVLSLSIGDWDLRRIIVSGKSKRFMRYTARLFEEVWTTLLKMQQSGHNVTQLTAIADLTHFNFPIHGCPRCIPLYLYILSLYEEHYPTMAHKLVALNVPQFAIGPWEFYKHFLSAETTSTFFLYGKNKEEWEQGFLTEVSKDQLSKKFGGLKEDGWDVGDFRRSGKVYECMMN